MTALRTLALLLVLTTPAWAKHFTGKVMNVSDGDTVKVLDASKTQRKVRMLGIDAPEKKQPFGKASREHLAELVAGKTVTVEYKKKDRYDRFLGKVLIEDKDAGLEQVRAGLAWHYKEFAREQEPADRESYSEAEKQARAKRLGLWQDPTSMEPWEFRKAQRRK